MEFRFDLTDLICTKAKCNCAYAQLLYKTTCDSVISNLRIPLM